MDEISVIGRTAAGVRGISLGEDDSVLDAFPNSEEGEIILVSDKGEINWFSKWNSESI